MLWVSISNNCFAQVTISNETALKIITALERIDSLKGEISDLTKDIKAQMLNARITDAKQEAAYKVLSNNYEALKKRFERYRNKSTFWRDAGAGLIISAVTAIIIFSIK
jgi:hypothetical protein